MDVKILRGGRILLARWRFIGHPGSISWTYQARNAYYSLHLGWLSYKPRCLGAKNASRKAALEYSLTIVIVPDFDTVLLVLIIWRPGY